MSTLAWPGRGRRWATSLRRRSKRSGTAPRWRSYGASSRARRPASIASTARSAAARMMRTTTSSTASSLNPHPTPPLRDQLARVEVKLIHDVEQQRAALDALLAGAGVDGDLERGVAVRAHVDLGEERHDQRARDLRRLHALESLRVLLGRRDEARHLPGGRGLDLGDDQPVLKDGDGRARHFEEGIDRAAALDVRRHDVADHVVRDLAVEL